MNEKTDDVQALKIQIEALLARDAAREKKLQEVLAQAAADSGVGRMPIPDTLQPTGLLSGVVTPPPPNVREGQRLYRVGIKPEVPFSLCIGVGPAVFASRTFRWSGKGEDAEIRVRNGSIVALTEDEVKIVQRKLTFMYYRETFHPSGTVLGIEVVDVSDGGSVTVDPATNQQSHHPAQRIVGRTQGNEKPLANILVFEQFGSVEHLGESVNVALHRAQVEQEEREDIEQTINAGIPGHEAGVGGKVARSKKLLKDLSTVTGPNTKASGGLLG